ncbi:MAG: hypothetical protein IPM54_17585 [Polyangiaceae bacterium]|nr:hypothetical protein [Polyangiaceae bacterium]
MHDRFAKRIEDGLERIERRPESEPKSPWIEARSNAKLGGFGGNERAAGRYRIQIVYDPTRAGGLKLQKALHD